MDDIMDEVNRTKCIFNYSISLHDFNVKEYIKWDCEIPQPVFLETRYRYKYLKKKAQAGIYIWHENQHGKNIPLYVGSSYQLQKRLWVHCSGSLGDNAFSCSNVWEYMKRRQYDMPFYCNQKDILCDCIPRYVVRYFVLKNDLGIDLIGWEHEVMHLLRPPLNKEIGRQVRHSTD